MSEQFDALVKLSVRDWKFRQALYYAPEEALRMAADAARRNHRAALVCGKRERTYRERRKARLGARNLERAARKYAAPYPANCAAI